MPGSVNILKQTDIFYKLNPTQLNLVANLCQERVYHAGEVIFPEGADSNELYIIVTGEVDIQVAPELLREEDETASTGVTIATLRRGQSFGEIALVDKGLRSATARAKEANTHLLAIPSAKLLTLCDTYPNLGYRLMQNLAIDLALKIRSTDLRIREELKYGQANK